MIFNPANILLPRVWELAKWPVVACDQFSSEREYWDRVSGCVGLAPSSLRLIVPEAYLDDGDAAERIADVGVNAEKYLRGGLFEEYPDSLILVTRFLRDGRARHGIVGAIDLAEYDYTGAPARIRATEKTVPSRLPPRAEARRGSPLETPHVMALIEDAENAIIAPLLSLDLPVLYDIDLMEDSGHLTGRLIDGELAQRVAAAVEALPGGIKVGDGNHSLAAAKLLYEENRAARYALVELNNVFDPAIDFHAIHRVVFGVDAAEFTANLKKAAGGDGSYVIKYSSGGISGEVFAKNAPIGDIIADIQDYIDSLGCRVDYIHGDAAFDALAAQPGNVGVYLPTMEKADLFKTVESRGVFPRKSFSIGEAWDKRFYMECRKIKE
ncbi:MAG: DUF1015 domain-containing protein [Oscillospiraceae bacterium]|jgi:hypothetical protein|nr:DUF1015 domain-containing protein [Oscillospiraceae bacterium]